MAFGGAKQTAAVPPLPLLLPPPSSAAEGGGGLANHPEDPIVLAMQDLGRSSKARVSVVAAAVTGAVGRSDDGGGSGGGGGGGGSGEGGGGRDSGDVSSGVGSSRNKSRSSTTEEVVILLTRLGGARAGVGCAGPAPPTEDSDDGDSYNAGGNVRVDAAKMEASKENEKDAEAIGVVRLMTCLKQRRQQEEAEAAAARAEAASARLRLLWALEEKRLDSGDGVQGGGVLLHACSGPGALRAVQEAIREGAKGVMGDASSVYEACLPRGCTENVGDGRGSSSSSRGGDAAAISTAAASAVAADSPSVGQVAVRGEGQGEEKGGVGCRIGGCTVVGLGSLRQHGAFCVVELNMPGVGGEGGQGGWSVAGVEFGKIDVGLGERETERLQSLGRGNFVLNFE